MNAWTMAWRSLRHYRRSNLAVLAGLAISAMTLVGALTVGDSVRYSLDRIALDRVGKASHAVLAQDRFFRDDLADRLGAELDVVAAPVLLFTGHVALPDGSGRVNDVQLLGVDDRFWAMAPGDVASRSDLSGMSDLLINNHLAERLGVAEGEAVVVRMGKPSDVPGDAPLSGEQDTQVSWRNRVTAVVDDEAFGRFGLQANQVAPYNVFVPLAALQERAEREGRANLVLLDDGAGGQVEVDRALRAVWRIEDVGLSCREVRGGNQLELRSSRIFLDPPAAEAALDLRPDGDPPSAGPLPVITYLVNTLASGTNATPYSMVSALPFDRWPGLTDEEPGPREMVVNRWLAEDLAVAPGDDIEATYFRPGPMGTLWETSASFRVHSVVALEGAADDPDLMPSFPGLADSDSCRTWEPGFALDLDRIREKDEAYWEDHRGTPKAFIPLATGARLWHTRFGLLTAVRYHAAHHSLTGIVEGLRGRLDPASMGIRVEPVRETALAASGQAMGFGGLFLGLSMFLLAAALILSGMLFAFGTLQRTGETGLRLAVGFTPRAVLFAFLREGLLVTVAATAVGALAGMAYTRLLLHALETVWQGAVGQTTLLYHARASSVLTGAAINVAAALLTMGWTLRRQVKHPAHTLLSTGARIAPASKAGRTRGRFTLAASALCGLGALCAVVFAATHPGDNAAPAFFAGGTLFLAAGLFACAYLLRTAGAALAAESLSRTRLVVLGLARRRGRSLGAVAMLACGTFMVIAVGSSRPDLRGTGDAPQSGTGGFNLIAELSQPILKDLNTAEGRAAYGIGDDAPNGDDLLEGIVFAQARVHEGDDASCLNLNRAQRPRLLGIDPSRMAGRFTFAAVLPEFAAFEDPWEALRADAPGGRIPGVVDQNSMLWAMGKKLGDTVTYADAHGQSFEVVLAASVAGSILQGSILIDEYSFLDAYPASGGYSLLLVDTTGLVSGTDAAQPALYRGLEDFGVSMEHTSRRLAALNEVQNTYLSMFLLLGGLGLILGTAGLGAVVLRNVQERRRELGLYRAVGFSKDQVNGIIASEHLVLLIAGFVCGLAAAVVGVLPSLLAPGAGVPYALLGAIAAGILINGILWTGLATVLALRGSMLEGLSSEF